MKYYTDWIALYLSETDLTCLLIGDIPINVARPICRHRAVFYPIVIIAVTCIILYSHHIVSSCYYVPRNIDVSVGI